MELDVSTDNLQNLHALHNVGRVLESLSDMLPNKLPLPMKNPGTALSTNGDKPSSQPGRSHPEFDLGEY